MEENFEDNDNATGPYGNYDLCVDLDNLGNDTRSPDDMYDVLNKDPEWTQDFSDIHVNQFTGPVGSLLGIDFDTSVASPLDYFQLFFLTMFSRRYVTIQTSLKNLELNKRR